MSLLLVLTSESSPDENHHCIASTFMSIWDVLNPKTPIATLNGVKSLTCACFAPNNSFVVAAGTLTGALALWDLREIGTPETAARDVAYTTNCLTCESESYQPIHSSAILNLCPMADPFASIRGNATFQLVSIDDRGLVAVWLVVESAVDNVSLFQSTVDLRSTNHGSVSHMDESLVGLRVGSNLRLTCSRSLAIWSSVPVFFSPYYDAYCTTERDATDARLLGRTLLGSDQDGSSVNPGIGFDSYLTEVGVGPGVSAFAISPSNSNEFVVALSACKR
jgi:hypothetical protein|tara:strand:- start:1278 stop:2111 length:834 start_codon:yes stop_codon:yes gene_type:complete